jgi:hypothetical protein
MSEGPRTDPVNPEGAEQSHGGASERRESSSGGGSGGGGGGGGCNQRAGKRAFSPSPVDDRPQISRPRVDASAGGSPQVSGTLQLSSEKGCVIYSCSTCAGVALLSFFFVLLYLKKLFLVSPHPVHETESISILAVGFLVGAAAHTCGRGRGPN